MSVFNTRPRFQDRDVKQLSGDTITLSGETNFNGVLRYVPGATTGYVLTALDNNGTVVWGPVSATTSTDTYITGGTLTGTDLTLDWNTGGSANLIDLSGLEFTGNTSGDCVTDLYITNLYGCSPITIHDSIQSITSSATGTTSFAFGDNTIAGGDYSHAEGRGSRALGNVSHAEGGSTASGGYSHAEGLMTIASGDYSHAEGRMTTASGDYSHTEGLVATASGDYSHAGGVGVTASGDTSFIHSTNSMVTADRSVLLGGQDMTGTTVDTVYVPNLTIRGDHVLQSDSVLEVSGLPSVLEDETKGFYTEFNWSGLTTNVLSNSYVHGYSSFLLGDLSLYPVTNKYGFLSYYNAGYNRSGSPATGSNFYQDKLVLKSAANAEGIIFSNEPTKSFWWEIFGESKMMLSFEGQLGIGLNSDGTELPTSRLDLNGSFGYNQLRLRNSYTPSSSGDTNGAVGDIAWDNNYLYIKTSTGWGRSSLDYAF